MGIFTASIGRFSVSVVSPADLSARYERLGISVAPPLISITRSEAIAEPLLEHTATSGSCALRLSADRRHLQIECPSESLDDGASLLHFAHLLLEREMQLQGYVTAHCAAVARDDKAALLLGNVGAGKTTTAIRLCLRHGFRLAANDLCVFGGVSSQKRSASVIAGSRNVLLRRASIERNCQDLLCHFPEPQRDAWLQKVNVSPRRLGIEEASLPLNVAGAFFVHIDQAQQRFYIEDYDGLIPRLYLNENFSRYIRATTTPMLLGAKFDFGDYMPPLDCPEAYFARRELIRYLLGDLKIKYISGTLEDVAAHISDQVAR